MTYMSGLSALISLLVGLGSGWIGAYMGMKIAVVKLQGKADIHETAINRLTVDVSAHRDDLLVHDMEIGLLMDRDGLERVRRQLNR